MRGIGYRHIISVLQNEAAARGITTPTILDAGCGNGALLAMISSTMPSVCSGFDSPQYGIQEHDVIGALAGSGIDIRTTHTDGSWPFENEQFDIVVSQQVGEHVADFDTFCAENARVLKPGGVGVHVFPLRHILIEPHMHLPFVHRIRDHEMRVWLISRLSRIGLGIYRSQGPLVGIGIDEFARSQADYLRTFATYRSWREVCDTFHRHGLRVSYRHTSTLVQRAFYRLAGRERAGHSLPPLLEAALFPVARSFVSSTIVVEKAQEYRFVWKTRL